ncbi:predicted protein [Naegleria gruberi]|uniref:Predicted protein n=1 Tax=Naegleria gruberi TaxID=5762 RepID=D2VPG4_NAEGR|nr:uncharacterized protein NAEGRDRAFT_70851 [Naegleria gruberi]EFC41427.1 predicted protein [Naegleria gruberi]|eukprot:XP_002674171.1 predicted protein [Naegleria gruberi strain NEG-M]
MDKGLIEIDRLKSDLVECEKSGDLYADFDSELEYVEPHEVKLSIDETDNWISRYVFYRYAKTFNVEESCYTMSRSQFDKLLTHLREVMGERGLGQDILIIKDVLDEGDEDLENPFEDDSIAASLASSNQIVLDVGSVLAELKQNRTITEGTFLNWFQSALVLYIMFKYNQY